MGRDIIAQGGGDGPPAAEIVIDSKHVPIKRVRISPNYRSAPWGDAKFPGPQTITSWDVDIVADGPILEGNKVGETLGIQFIFDGAAAVEIENCHIVATSKTRPLNGERAEYMLHAHVLGSRLGSPDGGRGAGEGRIKCTT